MGEAKRREQNDPQWGGRTRSCNAETAWNLLKSTISLNVLDEEYADNIEDIMEQFDKFKSNIKFTDLSKFKVLSDYYEYLCLFDFEFYKFIYDAVQIDPFIIEIMFNVQPGNDGLIAEPKRLLLVQFLNMENFLKYARIKGSCFTDEDVMYLESDRYGRPKECCTRGQLPSAMLSFYDGVGITQSNMIGQLYFSSKYSL